MLSFPSHDVPDHWVAVVDDQNRFIRWTSRAEIHQKYLPHRSIQAMIFTLDHHLVIQKRHPQKQTYPNHWDLSSSGHVERIDYRLSDLERLNQEWQSIQDPTFSHEFSSQSQFDHHQVYHRVALKEVHEEIGIELSNLDLIDTFTPLEGVHYEHFHLFRGFSNGPFVPQETEVAEIRTLSQTEWSDFIKAHPCTNSFKMLVHRAIEQNWWPT